MNLTNFRGCQVILVSSNADDICTNLVPILVLIYNSLSTVAGFKSWTLEPRLDMKIDALDCSATRAPKYSYLLEPLLAFEQKYFHVPEPLKAGAVIV